MTDKREHWPRDRAPRGSNEIAAVLAEHPRGWEYLALAGILLAERDALESQYRDHLLGYADPGERVRDEDVPDWTKGQLDAIQRTFQMMTSLMMPEVQQRAFGKPGEPG